MAPRKRTWEMSSKEQVDRAERIALNLTAREKFIVRNSPYDSGGSDWGYSRLARGLEQIGVLESDPQNRHVYRITSLGEDVLHFIGKNE